MKIGDLVVRKEMIREGRLLSQEIGLVLSKHIMGDPPHPCVRVYFSKLGKTYDMAEDIMEVLSESG